MRCLLTPFALAFLTACTPSVPDDRFIEVISETGSSEAEETETAVSTEPLPEPEPASENEAPAAGDVELCDAKDYKHLVGQSAGGTQFPVGPTLRVFGVDDIVTQEYVTQRTNIVADDSGKIVRVYCG